MVLSPVTVFAVASQNAQGQSSDNGNGSSGQSSSQSSSSSGSQGLSSSGSGNDVQTQNQAQTSNRGEDTQLQLSQEIQTKLSEVQDTYSAGNAAAKQSLANTSAAAAKIVELSASVEDQNADLATQLQDIAKAQVDATNEASKSIDEAESKNGFAKFFTGADYKQIKAANQQMEQNRQRIQELNQIKAQIENTSDATVLQNQINVLEVQNTSLQDQATQLDGGFSLFGWLFKWIS